MSAAEVTERRPLPIPSCEECLGRGSQAAVYRARLADHGAVAVKVFASAAACSRSLALRESQFLRWLDHPGVPTLYGASLEEPVPFLAMELFEGVSLHALRRRNRGNGGELPWWLLAHIALGAAEVLDHCWNHQPPGHPAPLRLVHGDLKPGNLMVCSNGQVGLIDFGVATSAHEPLSVRTGAGGTVGYFSPQRMLGAAPTPADDRYALGAALLSTALGGTRVASHPDPEQHEARINRLLDALPAVYAPLRPVLSALLCYAPAARPGAGGLRRCLAPLLPPASLRRWSVGRRVRSECREAAHAGRPAQHGLPTVPMAGAAA